MPPRQEDHLSLPELPAVGDTTPWSEPQSSCSSDLLSVELPALELRGPTEEEELNFEKDKEVNEEELLQEWVWKTHKEEICKNLTILRRRNKISPTKPVDVNLNNGVSGAHQEMELYKKRWELTHRVARATQNFLQNEGAKVVYQCLLNGLLELEESEYGFIGEVRKNKQGDPYIQIHASTTIEYASEESKRFFEDNDGYKFTNMTSMFGQIVTTGRPVLSNNVQEDMVLGCPYSRGHPLIENFLGLPLYGKEQEVIGILCIGNKKSGYSMNDVTFLEPFTATGSNLIQAYWQLEENKRLISELEGKVIARTKSLQESNQQLERANHMVVQTSRQQLQHFAWYVH